jgi:predicted TIM-barrel fold metal-dependent hydrolase
MMKRRQFLQSVTAAPVLLASACMRKPESIDPAADVPDLAGIPIVDTHVHPPLPMTLSQSYDGWNASFVDSMLPGYEYEGKEQLRQALDGRFKEHLYAMPRQIGYYNYVAHAYGVEPDLKSFDKVVADGIKRGFPAYIGSILDRERISHVVLESREAKPVAPQTHVPAGRFVWTVPIVALIQPEWAKANGHTGVDAVVKAISEFMETAVKNGCRGFKSSIAYYRPLTVEVVSKAAAERDLAKLFANPATRIVPGRNVADYQEPELRAAFIRYQDYLLRHIFIKAGELQVPIIIHTAVALHPALRFEFNSPLELHRVFLDDEIKKVRTHFLLIHTGYPYHDYVAALLSQFPDVYADVSFYSKFPGVLEETLRSLLALAPSEKVMHGSDSNNVPEEIGYCAANTRHVLAKILRDYRSDYGWSRRDCDLMANNVLHENAKKLFKI